MLQPEVTNSHKLVFKVELPQDSISSTTDFDGKCFSNAAINYSINQLVAYLLLYQCLFPDRHSKHRRLEVLYAESTVYKKMRSQIINGNYELLLKEEADYQPAKKFCTWDTIPGTIPEWYNNNVPTEDSMNEFEKFEGNCKILRLYFKWTKNPPNSSSIDKSELTLSVDLDSENKENDEKNNNVKEVGVKVG